MNALVLLPLALVIVPFLPTLAEMLRRKDKGPRTFPEQTMHKEGLSVQDAWLERARIEARTKEPVEVIRVIGNISIPEGTEMTNHLVVQGDLRLGKKCHLYGSIKAFGNVEVGEYSVVEGHVLSEGKIHIGRDSIIKGVVDSPQDITLEQNATVEAVSTEKTVKLRPGARINKRILSRASIVAFPEEAKVSGIEAMRIDEHPAVKVEEVSPAQPDKQKPSLVRGEPLGPKTVPTITGPESFRPVKPQERPERITDQIFRYLEERIRRFDETTRRGLEDVRLEGLSSNEVKVLRLAYMGSSLEEICLRLPLDPPKVQEILESLIRKGCLDKDLRPRRPVSRKGYPTEASEEKQEPRTEQPSPAEADVKEKKLEPQDELIERLIASKMREELKRKLEQRPKATSRYDDRISTKETTRTFGVGREETKRILEEWKKTSSLLWKTDGRNEHRTSGNPDSANGAEQTRTPSMKGNGATRSEENVKGRPRREDQRG